MKNNSVIRFGLATILSFFFNFNLFIFSKYVEKKFDFWNQRGDVLDRDKLFFVNIAGFYSENRILIIIIFTIMCYLVAYYWPKKYKKKSNLIKRATKSNFPDFLPNPFIGILFKPRLIVQSLIKYNADFFVSILAILFSWITIIEGLRTVSYFDYSIFYLIIIILFWGSIFGIIGLYLEGFLIKWTGRWLGGQGTGQHIRAVISWSFMPILLAILIRFPILLIYGNKLRMIHVSGIDNSSNVWIINWLCIIILGVAIIWSFIIAVTGLAAVQKFSKFKAFINIIFTLLIQMVLFFIISFFS